jgi:hypothetical protein
VWGRRSGHLPHFAINDRERDSFRLGVPYFSSPSPILTSQSHHRTPAYVPLKSGQVTKLSFLAASHEDDRLYLASPLHPI